MVGKLTLVQQSTSLYGTMICCVWTHTGLVTKGLAGYTRGTCKRISTLPIVKDKRKHGECFIGSKKEFLTKHGGAREWWAEQRSLHSRFLFAPSIKGSARDHFVSYWLLLMIDEISVNKQSNPIDSMLPCVCSVRDHRWWRNGPLYECVTEILF